MKLRFDPDPASSLAGQLWPGSSEAIEGLAGILNRTGRATEAQQLLDNFGRSHPDQSPAIETFRGTIVWTVPKSTQ